MINRDLVLQTIKSAMIESRETLIFMQNTLGREEFYRLIFSYPKKWSRRKIKKRGLRELDMVKLEYGLSVVVKRVEELGEEYKTVFANCKDKIN